MKLLPLFICLYTVPLFSQGFYATQPSFLTTGLHCGYVKEYKHWPKASLYHVHEIGVHFSLFPPQKGVATALSSTIVHRLSLSKKNPYGFGISYFGEIEWMINPIYYRDKVVERDLLFSLTPGIGMDWFLPTESDIQLVPYMRGVSRFFISTTYATDMRCFWGFDIGMSLHISRKTVKKFRKGKR